MLDEDDAPPGPLEAAEPPVVLPLLDEAPPLDDELPMPLPDVPPVPELADESDGALGAAEDDEEEPPGTMTVSFSRVVVVLDPLGAAVLPPGMTVVVSFFSQADSASAPSTTNRYPLRFMFTLLSSEKIIAKCTDLLAITVPQEAPAAGACVSRRSRCR